MNYCVRTNELYHYGILGMKWGVRRYQNTDGSYTAEGKRRRGHESKSQRLRRVKKMDDEELRTKSSRLELENRYLNAENNQREALKRRRQGSNAVSRVLEKSGDKILTAVVTATITLGITVAVGKLRKMGGDRVDDGGKIARGVADFAETVVTQMNRKR